ncbi:MAG: Smr/MutS family protein [Vicinamibacterales bacterium]
MTEDAPVPIPIDGVLDLHAFPPRDVPDVVDDYLEAARAAGIDEIRLVHGRGIGVQRAVVRRILATHPGVADFWDAPESHLGATVVRLKP